MACPNCKCKVTYPYVDLADDDYEMEKCAACGSVFYALDAVDGAD
jgi:hypothetical protein